MKMHDTTLTTQKLKLRQADKNGSDRTSGKRKPRGYVQDERLAKSLLMPVIGLLTIGCGILFGLVIMAAGGGLWIF